MSEGNDPSLNLLKNLGFKVEGIMQHNFKINRRWINDVKLGLLNKLDNM